MATYVDRLSGLEIRNIPLSEEDYIEYEESSEKKWYIGKIISKAKNVLKIQDIGTNKVIIRNTEYMGNYLSYYSIVPMYTYQTLLKQIESYQITEADISELNSYMMIFIASGFNVEEDFDDPKEVVKTLKGKIYFGIMKVLLLMKEGKNTIKEEILDECVTNFLGFVHGFLAYLKENKHIITETELTSSIEIYLETNFAVGSFFSECMYLLRMYYTMKDDKESEDIITELLNEQIELIKKDNLPGLKFIAFAFKALESLYIKRNDPRKDTLKNEIKLLMFKYAAYDTDKKKVKKDVYIFSIVSILTDYPTGKGKNQLKKEFIDILLSAPRVLLVLQGIDNINAIFEESKDPEEIDMGLQLIKESLDKYVLYDGVHEEVLKRSESLLVTYIKLCKDEEEKKREIKGLLMLVLRRSDENIYKIASEILLDKILPLLSPDSLSYLIDEFISSKITGKMFQTRESIVDIFSLIKAITKGTENPKSLELIYNILFKIKSLEPILEANFRIRTAISSNLQKELVQTYLPKVCDKISKEGYIFPSLVKFTYLILISTLYEDIIKSILQKYQGIVEIILEGYAKTLQEIENKVQQKYDFFLQDFITLIFYWSHLAYEDDLHDEVVLNKLWAINFGESTNVTEEDINSFIIGLSKNLSNIKQNALFEFYNNTLMNKERNSPNLINRRKYTLFQRAFQEINTQNKSLFCYSFFDQTDYRIVSIDKIIGFDSLWEFYVYAKDEEVKELTSDFLIHLLLNPCFIKEEDITKTCNIYYDKLTQIISNEDFIIQGISFINKLKNQIANETIPNSEYLRTSNDTLSDIASLRIASKYEPHKFCDIRMCCDKHVWLLKMAVSSFCKIPPRRTLLELPNETIGTENDNELLSKYFKGKSPFITKEVETITYVYGCVADKDPVMKFKVNPVDSIIKNENLFNKLFDSLKSKGGKFTQHEALYNAMLKTYSTSFHETKSPEEIFQMIDDNNSVYANSLILHIFCKKVSDKKTLDIDNKKIISLLLAFNPEENYSSQFIDEYGKAILEILRKVPKENFSERVFCKVYDLIKRLFCISEDTVLLCDLVEFARNNLPKYSLTLIDRSFLVDELFTIVKNKAYMNLEVLLMDNPFAEPLEEVKLMLLNDFLQVEHLKALVERIENSTYTKEYPFSMRKRAFLVNTFGVLTQDFLEKNKDKIKFDLIVVSSFIRDYFIKKVKIQAKKSNEIWLMDFLFFILAILVEKSPKLRSIFGKDNELIAIIIQEEIFSGWVDLEDVDKKVIGKKPRLEKEETNQYYNFFLVIFKDNENIETLFNVLNKIHKQNYILNHRLIRRRYSRRKTYDILGLFNQGMKCYMDSLLQQIHADDKLVDDILSQDSTVPHENSVLFHLQEVLANMRFSISSSYDPSHLSKVMQHYEGQTMDKMGQMDVDEFYNLLLERTEDYFPKDNNPFFKRFQGKLEYTLTCEGCPHSSRRVEAFNSLSLELTANKSYSSNPEISQSFKQFFQDEELTGSNMYYCESCNAKRVATKRARLASLPPVLVIVLKRFFFDFDLLKKVKNNQVFEFSNHLDLSQYTVDKELEAKYTLNGFIMHQGNAESGHYLSVVKAKGSEEYILVNDEKIEELESFQDAFGYNVKGLSAYVLIYYRDDVYAEKDKYVRKFDRIEQLSEDFSKQIISDSHDYLINKPTSDNIYTSFIIDLGINASSRLIELAKIPLITRNDNSDFFPCDRTNLNFSNLKEKSIFVPAEESEKSPGVNIKNLFKFIFKYFICCCYDSTNIISAAYDYFKLMDVLKLLINIEVENAKYVVQSFSNTEVLETNLIYHSRGNKILIEGLIYCSMIQLYKKGNEEHKEILKNFVKILCEIITEKHTKYKEKSTRRIEYLLYRACCLTHYEHNGRNTGKRVWILDYLIEEVEVHALLLNSLMMITLNQEYKLYDTAKISNTKFDSPFKVGLIPKGCPHVRALIEDTVHGERYSLSTLLILIDYDHNHEIFDYENFYNLLFATPGEYPARHFSDFLKGLSNEEFEKRKGLFLVWILNTLGISEVSDANTAILCLGALVSRNKKDAPFIEEIIERLYSLMMNYDKVFTFYREMIKLILYILRVAEIDREALKNKETFRMMVDELSSWNYNNSVSPNLMPLTCGMQMYKNPVLKGKVYYGGESEKEFNASKSISDRILIDLRLIKQGMAPIHRISAGRKNLIDFKLTGGDVIATSKEFSISDAIDELVICTDGTILKTFDFFIIDSLSGVPNVEKK